MTPQENQKLHHFLTQLIQVTNISKDFEAQELINAAVARQPHAAYLLVQRALILEAALDGARAQIAELQDRLQGAPSRGYGGSFLSEEDAWGNSARTAAAHPQAAQGYAAPPGSYGMAPGYGQPPAHAQGDNYARGSSGAGSFLGSMAATAAGVAGGAFLYRGLENMFSHHDAPAHGYGNPSDSAASPAGSASNSSLARDAGLNDIGGAGVANLDERARQDDSAGLMDDVGNDDVIPDDIDSGDDDSFI